MIKFISRIPFRLMLWMVLVFTCILFAFPMQAMHEYNINRQLINSISSNNLVEVERLLVLGADPNSTSKYVIHSYWQDLMNSQRKDFRNYRTALTHTANVGNLLMVKLLLKYGARVSRGDSCGMTELAYAEQKGLKDMTNLLLRHGSKKNRTEICM